MILIKGCNIWRKIAEPIKNAYDKEQKLSRPTSIGMGGN